MSGSAIVYGQRHDLLAKFGFMGASEDIPVSRPSPQKYMLSSVVNVQENVIFNIETASSSLTVWPKNDFPRFRVVHIFEEEIFWVSWRGIVAKLSRNISELGAVIVDFVQHVKRWSVTSVVDDRHKYEGFLSGWKNARLSQHAIWGKYQIGSLGDRRCCATDPILFDHLPKLAGINISELNADNEQKCVQDYLRPINAMPPFSFWRVVVGLAIAIVGFCIALRSNPGRSAFLGMFCIVTGAILALWSI